MVQAYLFSPLRISRLSFVLVAEFVQYSLQVGSQRKTVGVGLVAHDFPLGLGLLSRSITYPAPSCRVVASEFQQSSRRHDSAQETLAFVILRRSCSLPHTIDVALRCPAAVHFGVLERAAQRPCRSVSLNMHHNVHAVVFFITASGAVATTTL